MEKIKITQISRFTNDKQGNPLTTKDGRPYTRVNLKTDKYGDKWLSGFGNKDNAEWKQGDEVEIIVKQNGEYLNFDTPKKEDKSLKELNDIAIKVAIIQNDVKRIINHLTGEDRLDRTSDNTPIPDFNPPEYF